MKLQLKNICVTFEQKRILENLCMDVQDGEFVALIGPSGCGKSTLLNILAGVLTPESGEVFVDGTPVHGVSSRFAYMPQNDLLLPWKTILDNVTLYGRLHGQKKQTQEAALKEFPVFGLQGYEHAYPDELSGGMRQRAAFLRTALCSADIMLLDEPFGALDVITRNEMQDWLLRLRAELGRATLLVTHDIDEALYLADRIVVLGGRPASVTREIDLTGVQKSRDWLYEQSDLRKEIHRILRNEIDY
ncbi:ABC transporter ATP-binding protein [Butyricicoccus pullicaecorum]|uniref:ABC transporter ATP-binding protein n=1 Tax=Butyricicoccus pullicaecorum TaxID=501571 RepID=UPI0035225B64